jgi:hypothetical protein
LNCSCFAFECETFYYLAAVFVGFDYFTFHFLGFIGWLILGFWHQSTSGGFLFPVLNSLVGCGLFTFLPEVRKIRVGIGLIF